ncbi:MAG: cation:proton antiporter subunit C [Thermoplasmata archaeon]
MIESITGGLLNAQLAGIILLLIGLYGLITNRDLIKIVISINVLSTGVFLFFTSLGHVSGGNAPLIINDSMVDPIPATLMLTTFVIDVAETAFALALILKMRSEEK